MKFILILLTALGASLSAHAVTLGWDANTETNLAGYRIYIGRASRVYYTNFIHTNLTETIHTVSNLLNGTNFFALTAYDTDGLESDYSDEVSTIVTNRPAKVQGIRFRAQLAVQAAPSVVGPWSAAVEIAQLDTTPGSQFYRLQLAPYLQNNVTPPPVLPLTSGSKTGKLVAPQRTRQIPAPPKLP